MPRTLSLARNPDADHEFLHFAIARGLVDMRGIEFKREVADIETLNRRAVEGAYDLTAISFHAYAHVCQHYVLLSTGASVGDGFGPVLISRRSLTSLDLEECKVAVAGEWTTASLALRIFCPGARLVVMPYDKILPEVAKGNMDAGLVVLESQIEYAQHGLRRILDLGEWWRMETGLPLPLRGHAIRRSLDPATRRTASEVFRETVRYALDHPKEAMRHALEGRPDAKPQAHGMYLNSYTMDLGERGEQAVDLLLKLGHEKGIIPRRVQPEFED